MDPIKVIDVSQHNGYIDWKRVKESGITHAIIRCGYGDDVKSQDDIRWEENYKNASAVGIVLGTYLYSYALSKAQAQSELAHILRCVKGKSLPLGIWLDCEEFNTRNFTPTCCEIVLEGLKSAGHKTVGVYANTSWWHNYLFNVTKYPRWVAQYYTECTCKYPKVMWQFTSNGRVNGINHAVDVSYLYDTSFMESKTPEKTTTTTVKKEPKEPAIKKATSTIKFAISGKIVPSKKSYFKAKVVSAPDGLCVRRWANDKRAVLKVLKNGTEITVCDIILGSDKSQWYYICHQGKYGFVHSAYVKKCK